MFRAAWVLALFLTSSLRAQVDSAQFKADLAALCAGQSRTVGSTGYYATAKYLETEIAKLPNVELRQQEFPVMVPVTQLATLDLGNGRIEKVYPFWPAQ